MTCRVRFAQLLLVTDLSILEMKNMGWTTISKGRNYSLSKEVNKANNEIVVRRPYSMENEVDSFSARWACEAATYFWR